MLEQAECDKMLKEKRAMESVAHEYSVRNAEHVALNGALRERLDAMGVEQGVCRSCRSLLVLYNLYMQKN